MWCEKDALSSVLAPIAEDLHVLLMVNRGYSSSSAMYTASKRLIAAAKAGKPCDILYLGDFDPSGEDMVRDVKERLSELGATVDVKKIALNPDQVKQYKLPPNPAKRTDSRSSKFIAEHGGRSYEVDALPPNVLMALVRSKIEALMDMARYRRWQKREEADRKRLLKFAESVS